MNAGQIKMVGISGLISAIAEVVRIVALIIIGAAAVTAAVKAGGDGKAAASASVGGSTMILQIISLVVELIFAWMLFMVGSYLSKVRGRGAAMTFAMIAIAIIIVQIILGFISPGSTGASFQASGIVAIIMLVLFIVKGVMIILLGVNALQGGSGAWKAWGVLAIIAGACTAVIVLSFLSPFLWIAAGIVLMVAASGSAKTASA